MAFIQGGFNAGQNPFINQFPTSFGAPAFGGAQQSFGFNPQQAQMMFMLQALMQAMQQMSQGWGGFAGGGGQQVPQVGGGGGYGDPTERDRETVREDVRCGRVSEQAAADIYGLVNR